ncbi:MAG: caspase family protein [Myxococcales bacterium]|nr:caspase family protein [Myxococcales bacterium]
MPVAFALAAACALAGAGGNGAFRIAVVAGHPDSAGKPSLRFAESDASRVARLLAELGGFERGDVSLLRSPSGKEIEEALSSAQARILERRRQGGQSLLFFYFSGHGAAEGLELGEERLAYGRLRQLLAQSGADLKVAVVDACGSSSVLRTGGRPAPAFEISVEDRLTTTGEVFIASSAAGESALESAELRGSVFTSHLLAGLRGAADRSGDGRVSLDEAYRYAYERTSEAGTQHPGFGLRLSGHGELVLSSLSRARSTLSLPASERLSVVDASSGEVIARLDGSAARLLALPPGRYELAAVQAGQRLAGRVSLKEGARGSVGFGDLRPAPPERAHAAAPPGVTPTSLAGPETSPAAQWPGRSPRCKRAYFPRSKRRTGARTGGGGLRRGPRL